MNVSSLYGVTDASHDFFGNAISASTAVVGADAVGSSLTATPIATTSGGSTSGSSSSSSSGSTAAPSTGSSSTGSSSTGSSSSSSSSSAKTGTITGTITENGKALAGITVFLDPHNSVKFVAGDLTTTTSSSGTYSFSGVSAGANIVREILPSGDTQVTPTRSYGNHITVSAGSTVSNQNFSITGSTGVSSSLPTGWTSADIGSVAAKGTAAYANGTYALTGSGADIWNTSDDFQFTYTSLTGNGQIVAELDSLTEPNSWAKAGVMIRSSSAANAADVSLTLSPDQDSAQLQDRSATGKSTAITKSAGSVKPAEWLKLVRSGNVITGYLSKDDKTWTELSSDTVAMGSTVEIGLAVTSHDNGTLAAATFSNVAVS